MLTVKHTLCRQVQKKRKKKWNGVDEQEDYKITRHLCCWWATGFSLFSFCLFDCVFVEQKTEWATDLRPKLLGEGLFLTALHCKHTTGHASFGAPCQATGIPSLCFSLLSFYSSLSPSFPPSRLPRQANGRGLQGDYWTSRILCSLSVVCRTLHAKFLPFVLFSWRALFCGNPRLCCECVEISPLKCGDWAEEGIVVIRLIYRWTLLFFSVTCLSSLFSSVQSCMQGLCSGVVGDTWANLALIP